MAEVVMILGESGSGKSASLRNFKAGEVCVLNVAGKRLPFRNDWGQNVLDASGFRDRYSTIAKAVQKPAYKRYVIDDSQYLMAFDAFDRAKETGYGKFVDMAQSFYRLIMACKSCPGRHNHRIFCTTSKKPRTVSSSPRRRGGCSMKS